MMSSWIALFRQVIAVESLRPSLKRPFAVASAFEVVLAIATSAADLGCGLDYPRTHAPNNKPSHYTPFSAMGGALGLATRDIQPSGDSPTRLTK